MTKEEYRQEYLKKLDSYDFDEYSGKSGDCYVVLIRGRRMRTRKGKSVWTTKGAAASALRHYLCSLGLTKNIDPILQDSSNNSSGFRSLEPRRDYAAMREATKEAQDEWIEKNIIIIPLSDWLKGRKA